MKRKRKMGKLNLGFGDGKSFHFLCSKILNFEWLIDNLRKHFFQRRQQRKQRGKKRNNVSDFFNCFLIEGEMIVQRVAGVKTLSLSTFTNPSKQSPRRNFLTKHFSLASKHPFLVFSTDKCLDTLVSR